MTSIEVRRLGNKILAMGVATVLALSAIGVATPALTPAPVYATIKTTNTMTIKTTNTMTTMTNTMTTMTNTMTTMTIIIHHS